MPQDALLYQPQNTKNNNSYKVATKISKRLLKRLEMMI